MAGGGGALEAALGAGGAMPVNGAAGLRHGPGRITGDYDGDLSLVGGGGGGGDGGSASAASGYGGGGVGVDSLMSNYGRTAGGGGGGISPSFDDLDVGGAAPDAASLALSAALSAANNGMAWHMLLVSDPQSWSSASLQSCGHAARFCYFPADFCTLANSRSPLVHERILNPRRSSEVAPYDVVSNRAWRMSTATSSSAV